MFPRTFCFIMFVLCHISLLLIKVLIGFFLLILIWPSSLRKRNNPCSTNDSHQEKWADNVPITQIIFSRNFLIAMLIGALCFGLLRTSLNFYQPILRNMRLSPEFSQRS